MRERNGEGGRKETKERLHLLRLSAHIIVQTKPDINVQCVAFR